MSTAASPQATPYRRVAVNYALLVTGEFFAKILTFFVYTHLARTLGQQRYGSLEFVLAVMVFFALPVDFGLGAYGAREIAKNPLRASQLFREITGMRLILSFCSLGVLAVFTLVIDRSLEEKVLLGLYGVSLLAMPALVYWFFQAHDLTHWVGIASLIRQAVFAAFLIVFFHQSTPLYYIGVAECGSVAAAGLFGFYVMRNRMGYALEWPSLEGKKLFEHWRQSMPIGWTELAWAAIWYFSTVLLGLYADHSLGWFGASHRVLMALHTFVWLYFFNLLPSISRCANGPPENLLRLTGGSIRLVAWAGVFGAFLLTALGEQIFTLAYGRQFAGAALFFSVMVWMLPLSLLSGHHRYILIGYNLQNYLLRATVVSGVLAVVLNLVLIPRYGAMGAAWSLLIANSANFALAYYYVRTLVVPVPFAAFLARPLAATAVAGLVFLRCSRWNIWAAAAAATAVYLLLLISVEGKQVRGAVRRLLQQKTTAAMDPIQTEIRPSRL